MNTVLLKTEEFTDTLKLHVDVHFQGEKEYLKVEVPKPDTFTTVGDLDPATVKGWAVDELAKTDEVERRFARKFENMNRQYVPGETGFEKKHPGVKIWEPGKPFEAGDVLTFQERLFDSIADHTAEQGKEPDTDSNRYKKKDLFQ